MSTFDLNANLQSAKEQQAQGEDSFLTQEERDVVKRLLQFPEEFPQKFGSWIEDYITTNGVILQSQVQGLAKFSITVDKTPATGDAFEDLTSLTYASPATTGPILQLPSGKYILFFGFQVLATGTVPEGVNMSPSVNGAVPSDANSCSGVCTVAGYAPSTMRALQLDLSDANNTLVFLYRTANGNAMQVLRRWAVAFRYGTV